jgi:hypothetical protein
MQVFKDLIKAEAKNLSGKNILEAPNNSSDALWLTVSSPEI